MRRRLFTLASAVSLLLCVATAVLWVRGNRIPVEYWRQNYDAAHSVYGQDTVDILSGVIGVWRVRGKVTDPQSIAALVGASPTYRWRRLDWVLPRSPDNALERLGFYTRTNSAKGLSSSDPQMTVYYLAAPYWFVLILFATPPAVWLALHIKRRRRIQNHCPHCDYNLTGNASGVCPECGAAVTAKAGA